MSDNSLASRGFTKLDSGIIYSTLWWQSDSYLRVWIALLALCDARGMVRASTPALAQICLKSVDEVTEILQAFESPDRYSRIKAHEGRKIKTVEGGWIILNYPLYRGLRQRKPLSHAERQQRYRDRQRNATGNVTQKSRRSQSDVTITEGKVTHTVTRDTEAEADKAENKH